MIRWCLVGVLALRLCVKLHIGGAGHEVGEYPRGAESQTQVGHEQIYHINTDKVHKWVHFAGAFPFFRRDDCRIKGLCNTLATVTWPLKLRLQAVSPGGARKSTRLKSSHQVGAKTAQALLVL